jgi:hypothetical protein
MNALKWMLAGLAVGMILVAFRDFENETWLVPGRTAGGDDGARDEEPFLGYDGMDEETLLEWLEDASPDRGVLRRIRGYEAANRARGSVLEVVDGLL